MVGSNGRASGMGGGRLLSSRLLSSMRGSAFSARGSLGGRHALGDFCWVLLVMGS